MLRFSLLLVAVIAVIPLANSDAADDFRCETEIFVGSDKEPVQESLTLFSGKLVYDFPVGKSDKGGEITVYDFGRGTIELLNPHRKIRCKILINDLIRFTALNKTYKAESELFKFCIEPVFENKFADNQLSLTSQQFTYVVKCVKPEQTGMERRYCEFADWSAQLNAMRPGSLPPFPRMKLNEALAAEGMLPEEIERTITTKHLTSRRTETIRSKHSFIGAIAVPDRERIEQVGDLLVKLEPTSPDDYLGLVKKMANK
jgi:hypothetical protein